MNGRIRQLCQQKANYWMNHYDRKSLADMSLLYNDVEKFAELIVEECMRMCEVTEMSFVTHGCDVEASGAITVKQFIAEHFGVEE
jgi:hypothetical protein